MSIVDLNFSAIAPLITLATAALLVLILDLILPYERSRPWWYAVSLGGILLSFWYTLSLWSGSVVDGLATGMAGGSRITDGITAFGGAYTLDRFGLLFGVIVLGAAFLATLLSFFRKEKDVAGYLALILWASMGMMVLAGAGNFLTLFLGLELLSLSLYVLVAFGQEDARAKEAGFKYLVLGSVASAAMLYGLAFVYGQTGTMAFDALLEGWTGGGSTLMKVGVGLVILSFAFKLALVPFHKWAPDVYQGASAPVTAFMTVGTRAAAFAGLARFLMAVLPDEGHSLLLPLWVVAGLSMVAGSLGACVQTNVKRLLAYSGIAHAGYLSMSLLGLNSDGISAGAFYLMSYLFMNLGAFAILVWVSRNGEEGDTLDDLAGLFQRRPVLAGTMTLFMLSLIGFPTTAGFSGKLILVSSALNSDVGSAASWLVGGLALTSAISAYAYVKVIMAMFGERQSAAERAEAGIEEVAEVAATDEPSPEQSSKVANRSVANRGTADEIGFSWSLALVVTACVAGTLYLGLMPKSALAIATNLLPLS